MVGLARFNGHAVGVIASDSQHVNGGALTADGCRKLIRHLDLCDLFHLPVLNLVDNPGFAVGIEHEINGTIRTGGEWMVAFAQTTVPLFTVLMRRSFGVAGNNYATPRSEPSMRATTEVRPGAASKRSTSRPAPSSRAVRVSALRTSWPDSGVPSLTQALRIMACSTSTVLPVRWVTSRSVMARPYPRPPPRPGLTECRGIVRRVRGDSVAWVSSDDRHDVDARRRRLAALSEEFAALEAEHRRRLAVTPNEPFSDPLEWDENGLPV